MQADAHRPTAWIDGGRVAATWAVVVVHVSADVLTGHEVGSSAWWSANLYDASARWCVPVFVMVSGALLLGTHKTDRAGSFLLRRARRLLIPLAFWATVYTAWKAMRSDIMGLAFSWHDAAADALHGQAYFHLWFLYMLVGLYLFAPLIDALVTRCDRPQLWALTGLALGLSALTDFAHVRPPPRIFLLAFLPYVGYFLAGHLIATSRWRRGAFMAVLVLMGSVVVTAAGCYRLSQAQGLEAGLSFYSYLSVPVITMSLAAMWLARSLRVRRKLAENWLAKAAPLTLGIYVIHPLLLGVVALHHAPTARWPGLTIPAYALAIFAASMTLTAALKRIPLLRHVA